MYIHLVVMNIAILKDILYHNFRLTKKDLELLETNPELKRILGYSESDS